MRLAIAAMKVRGVSRARFQALHPGGTIGRRLLRVAAAMHGRDRIPLVHADEPMRNVIVTMTTMSFGIAGVVNDAGALIGAITDGDLRRHLDDAVLHARAGDVMTAAIPSRSRPPASSRMRWPCSICTRSPRCSSPRTKRRRVPIGMIHIHDLLRLGIA